MHVGSMQLTLQRLVELTMKNIAKSPSISSGLALGMKDHFNGNPENN